MRSAQVDGAALRRHRELAGMHVSDLVERVSQLGGRLGADQIYRIERGSRQPSPHAFAVLTKALECKKEDLLAA